MVPDSDVRLQTYRPRSTLAVAVRRVGVGVHGGGWCAATVAPAAPGAGLRVNGAAVGPASPLESARCTTLLTPAGPVRMVEHLLAALTLRGIDDAEVTVEGGEVPILDGSAAPWFDALVPQAHSAEVAPPRPLVITRAVSVGTPDRWLRAEPPGAGPPEVEGPALWLDVTVDHGDAGRWRWAGDPHDAAARVALASARTYGHQDDARRLQAAGLALGAGLENTLVLDGRGAPVAGQVFRGADEPARHKALDLLGDLALLGRPLVGRVSALRPGHALNHALVAALALALLGGCAGQPGGGGPAEGHAHGETRLRARAVAPDDAATDPEGAEAARLDAGVADAGDVGGDDGDHPHAAAERAALAKGEAALEGIPGRHHLVRPHPRLRAKAVVLYHAAAEEGIALTFISGYRRYRTPRRKPRRARASWHHFGLAIDVNLSHRRDMRDALRHFRKDWPSWQTVGRIANELELVWGLPWGRKEVFHFEWHPGLPNALVGALATALLAEAAPNGTRYEEVWKRFEGGRAVRGNGGNSAGDGVGFGGSSPTEEVR